ncbi:MAG: hypothetical protein Q9162_004450 [Coniocarpon cinnabarinum]
MALRDKYSAYLARPSIDALAPGALLHYIPTTVTITEPAAILKHHTAQEQQFKKKENFLNVIEGPNSICVETETTFQFEGGGGTFLPGLDDNFLADRSVSLPIIHVVVFDKNQKIQQIRLMWDQGSLLKSVDVVGSRGKNWPLSDGKDQIRTLTTSIDDSLSSVMNGVSINDGRQGRQESRGGGANSQTNIQLFSPRSFEREESPANPIAPRASARPPQRDPSELFSDGIDLPPERSLSPTKRNPLKAGAGKAYQEPRLFDQTPLSPSDPASPERQRKANPKKYDHFEFGETPLNVKSENRRSKHMSQWNFEDFVTPHKPRPRANPGAETQIDWMKQEQDQEQHRQAKPQPRKDAEPHFEFDDAPTPTGPGRSERVRPQAGREGLYEDHVNPGDPEKSAVNSIETTAGPQADDKMPLGNITNVNAQGHKKNFSSQWEMTDESPTKGSNENVPGHNAPEARKKVAKTMEANWAMYDESPTNTNTDKKHKGIQISGDGMGGRKTPGEKPWWEFE